MAQVRKQIIDAVAAALAGQADVGSRVFVNSVAAYSSEELPLLHIVPANEPINTRDSVATDPVQERSLVIDVEVLTNLRDAEQEERIALWVEQQMHTAELDADLVEYLGMSRAGRQGGGMELGNISLRFEVTYSTLASDPETRV